MKSTKPLVSKIGFVRYIASTALACAFLLAFAGVLLADGPPRYSPWSPPVNLGPIVNSTGTESGAFISKDGLSLYFNSYERPGGYGGFDIWVAQRPDVSAPWGTPVNLGPTVNTSGNEQTPTLSVDGHLLFFASDYAYPESLGGLDLYASRRTNKRDDLGWRTPAHLGSAVNSPLADSGPALFEDDETGTLTLYFCSDRAAPGKEDIYASTLQPDETFGPASPVAALNTTARDARPAIGRNGLEMFLDSNRPGSLGGMDLYVATRASTAEPWSAPVHLGAINSTVLDARPALSFDGTELYFHSDRPGGYGLRNLYVSTRTRLKGKP